jgi:hypothetical protein
MLVFTLCQDHNPSPKSRRSARYLLLLSIDAHLFTSRCLHTQRRPKNRQCEGTRYIPSSELVLVLTFLHPQALIVIPRHNSHIQAIKHILQENGKVLSKTLPGTVVKFSWASLTTRSIEPDLLRDCSGLFGTLKHYYSFLVCHGDDSPATNHLFLPAPGDDRQSLHWPLFVHNSTPPEPDYRALWGYASAYSGHSLMTASSSKELILAIFHASLGMWL